MSSYLKRFKDYDLRTTERIKEEGIYCGNESGYKKKERIRITTELISEKYKSKLFKKNNNKI